MILINTLVILLVLIFFYCRRIEIEVRRKTEEELERKKMGKDGGKLQVRIRHGKIES
jgi:hypothetical protein